MENGIPLLLVHAHEPWMHLRIARLTDVDLVTVPNELERIIRIITVHALRRSSLTVRMRRDIFTVLSFSYLRFASSTSCTAHE